MKTKIQTHSNGFTLIELMAVIVIIVILAGIVVGGLGFVNDRQARSKAQTQISLLSAAIEEYKLDMGAYPGTDAKYGGSAATAREKNTRALYTGLFYEGQEYAKNQSRSDPNGTKATKIYLAELNPLTSTQGWVVKPSGTTIPTNQIITDPWGMEYNYCVGKLANGNTNTNAQNPDFDLSSYGKDTKYEKQSGVKVKDDIKNF